MVVDCGGWWYSLVRPKINQEILEASKNNQSSWKFLRLMCIYVVDKNLMRAL